MNILWVIYGSMVNGDLTKSSFASHRYRALLPARGLREAGHQVTVAHAAALPTDCVNYDAIIIGKLFDEHPDRFNRDSNALIDYVKRAKEKGIAIIVDVCDDHFQRPSLSQYLQTIVRLANCCSVGSEKMGETVERYTDSLVRVIGDPLASPQEPAQVFKQGVRNSHGVAGQEPLHLAWYGRPDNFPPLKQWALQLAPLAKEQPFVLRVISIDYPTISSFAKLYNAQFAPRASIDFIPWSESNQWEAVKNSDLVLIPTDLTDPQKIVKSANRLTDALHCGRFVVASPLPAYKPFSEYAELVNSPASAVRWYLANPIDALSRIKQGQAAVIEKYSLPSIAAMWLGVLEEAISTVKTSDSGRLREPVSRAPTRLNLGCGDKILPGYINIDVVPSRSGQKPDVICDLHRLTNFSNDSADEVMAIHVIEHFWRWEVEDLLREWVRVLKPGGRLILECPNLVTACEEFLADPDSRADGGPSGHKTMWVFYGDPAWKDPLMMHRWGYTPTSLSRLLESVGLTEVQQEPAQFKLREPRDMRIVGKKPFTS